MTSFGRVQRVEGGLIVEKVEEESDYGGFREYFLDDAVAILESLSKKPKTVSQVSATSGLSAKIVEMYLPFLEEITRFGVITRRQGEFTPKWQVAAL